MSEKLGSVHKREKNDPAESDRPWHLLIWAFLMLMTSWGGIYIALYAGDGEIKGGDNRTISIIRKESKIKKVYAYSQERAKSLYRRHCVACHQASGLGVKNAFPPLSGSSWVTDNKMIPTKILLKGLEGNIDVLGVTYNGVMPSFAKLPNDEIADLVNYIRSSWQNKKDTDLTEDEVKNIRQELPNTSKAWSAKELR